MTYHQAVEYLLQIPLFQKKNRLEHTRVLWEALGRPGDGARKVHVAGTNGKGSVCAYLEAILRAAGKSTGMFTSPHLVRINERFRINGQQAADDQFLAAFQRVFEAVLKLKEAEGSHPSFFEYLFLMGMVLFEEEGTEYIILETGLGGRLDSTNIFTDPALTVITSIGLDHTEYLGETRAEIALEKAGIMKPKVPALCLYQDEETMAVLQKQAKAAGAFFVPVFPIDNIFFQKEDKSIDFCYKSRYDSNTIVTVRQSAQYQVENAQLALRAAELLLPGLTIEVMQRGLLWMDWEGRMERREDGVIFDGAHNEDGIRAFLQAAGRYQEADRKILLFAVVRDKHYEAMIRELAGAFFDEIILTQLANERAVPAAELKEVFDRYAGGHTRIVIEREISAAYGRGLTEKGKKGLLFVAGSLYLIGAVKSLC